MNILAIDTSNDELGIAIAKDDKVIGELITSSKQDHSTRLMPAIVDMMSRVYMDQAELDAIIVTHGPGSYTGTRIGITTAKTMAWALNVPIYTVSSLALLAMNGRLSSYYICPFYNARRGLVFTSLYKWEGMRLIEVEQERNVLMNDWLDQLKQYEEPILFISPQIDIFEESINEKMNEQAIIINDALQRPFPSNMLTMLKWIDSVDVHQVAPNYLRKTEAEANLENKQKGE